MKDMRDSFWYIQYSTNHVHGIANSTFGLHILLTLIELFYKEFQDTTVAYLRVRLI